MMTIAAATGSAVIRRRAVPTRRVRVLHVALNLEAGGLERLVVDLVNRADPVRFDSHVLVLEYAGRHASELRNPAALHVSDPLGPLSMLRPTALAHTIRSIGPEVVHTHSGVWYKASLAARLAGIRHIVHTDHGRLMPDSLRNRVVDAIAARRTTLVVAVSEPLADYMHRRLRVPSSKLRVVRNGVDTSLASLDGGSGIRHELGLPDDTPVIGSVGRLDYIKGYDILLEAFRRLRDDWTVGRPPVLVIAGDGPEMPRLREMLDGMDASVRRGVHLLGWRPDIPDVLAAFDVFAMTSRSEGTSLGLLEAMSAGICPLVTNVGGNAAVLGDDLAHRMLPTENAAEFARALAAVLRDGGARRRDAVRARARVTGEFSVGAMVKRYERLYAALSMS